MAFHYKSEIGQWRFTMTVSELQLQFIRLYKEMDATYY